MTDFSKTKALFDLPEGVIYLDGNSLGALPKKASERVKSMIDDEWGQMLIRGWNDAGWMHMPAKLGDRIGQLVGAKAGTIVTGDTLSIKVYQALAAALNLAKPERKIILSDSGNFPTDLYMAEGLLRTISDGYELKIVEPHHVSNALDDSVAVLMLTEVDYRTGRLHDMAELTIKAHEAGAMTIWDLAHSAGARPVDLDGCRADFAVGCTYKYLNGGPGAPAFIYVNEKHADHITPALSGWLGHEAPFAFDLDYRPQKGVDRMRVGTPPVLQMAALDTALDIWDEVDIKALHQQSMKLSERFIAGVEAACPQLELASPRDPKARGSQVAFHFDNGYPAMQALIASGVIGDFRAPDIMRFGFTPLYIDEGDVDAAITILSDIINNKKWDRPEFHAKRAVT